MKQNLTISLEKDLIAKARVISARRRTSVSRMLADELRNIVEQDKRYEAARQKALADLKRGFHTGGSITATRDDLHEGQRFRRCQYPDLCPRL